MISGKNGMGIQKHYKSGNSGKSPKFRHRMKMEAERSEVKSKPSSCKYNSVSELFKK